MKGGMISLFLLLLLPFSFSLQHKLHHTLSSLQSSTKLLVGYWHNFDNGIGIIKLPDISSDWDVVNVAFAETDADYCTLVFTPCYGTIDQFKQDIQLLQNLGKKVVLSIGGQNGNVLLPTEEAKQKFIKSAVSLITQYGFNGLDIDLENGIVLSGSDTDYKSPKSPQMVNLISAFKSIAASFSSSFILSMAPEIAYVQGALSAYAGVWGAYLPIIYGLKDKLNYIHVQHYNAGGASALDGGYYSQGTADFEVAMAEMLLKGFPIANNNNNIFPALREDQVMIGLPACSNAAPSGGYISPTEMTKALNYLTKGISFGGKYKIAKASGYPNFKGLMTWSINWDKYANFEFSKTYRSYFGKSGTIIVPTPTPIPVPTPTPSPTPTPTPNPTPIPIPSPNTYKLQASVLSITDDVNGVFEVKGTIPCLNSAKKFVFYENGLNVYTGNLSPGDSQAVVLTLRVSKTQDGIFSYILEVSDDLEKKNSNIVQVSVSIQSDGYTLKAAVLSYAGNTTANGKFVLSANIPGYNTATNFKIFENNVEVFSGTLNANVGASSLLEHEVIGKSAGVYNYIVSLYDVNCKKVDSNQVSVTVTSSSSNNTSGVKEWVMNSLYNVGNLVLYKGLTYQALQKHVAYDGYYPDVVPALWKKI